MDSLKKDLKNLARSDFAKRSKGFFREMNDEVMGVSVPNIRSVARVYAKNASFVEIDELLKSDVHEYKYAALEILVAQYQAADEEGRKQIKDFYLSRSERVDNWDLVDTSAYKILGEYLLKYESRNAAHDVLKKLATSKNIWSRRIAIVSTLAFIRQGDTKLTLWISEQLLKDHEDLIHKACGWMLREVGKVDREALEQFIIQHKKDMPRTMLRYSIERFSKEKRNFYLKK